MDVSKHSGIVFKLGGALVVAAFTTSWPEVSSEEWCDNLKAKLKDDSNEAAYFAKNCFFLINTE